MDFDYIIVGGGSAGCVLANRLSQDAANRVLLLEAGGSNRSMFVQIPFLTTMTLPYWLKNWHYFTTPQPGLNGRKGYQPRGKVLGGSSGTNAMIYIRGQQADYDEWATTTSAEWTFDAVLPTFKQFENNQRLNGPWHGQQGELTVSDLQYPNPASQAFVASAKALGYPTNDDFNGAHQAGAGLYQVTQKNGLRNSAADAFLTPIMARKNLTILTKAHVMKLLFAGKRCTGVDVRLKGNTQQFAAKKRVILAAGAINSPQLLLLSGIGPKDELKALNIPVVHDLPGVGKNFHDHPDYVHCYKSTHKDLIGFTPSGMWDIAKAFWQYRQGKPSMISTNFAEAGAFISSDASIERPDLQLHFVTGIVDNHARNWHFNRGLSCHVCVLRPKSRGEITLSSASPFDAPLINPNFLSDEADLALLVKGYKLTEAIMMHDELSRYQPKSLFKASSEDDIIRLIKARADTVYHPVGSCRMGNDEMAVVNPHLEVHGMEGLSVVDASVMPSVVSGNTNAPTMMIAEKAAFWMLNEPQN